MRGQIYVSRSLSQVQPMQPILVSGGPPPWRGAISGAPLQTQISPSTRGFGCNGFAHSCRLWMGEVSFCTN